MEKRILITGGTGLIGKALIQALRFKKYSVSVLSTHPKPIKDVEVFQWNIKNRWIDKNCFNGVTTIVHLAGENIAQSKWTHAQKREIISSRVDSTNLIFNSLRQTDQQVDTFISASAVGFYGDRQDEILSEESPKGQGFLPDVCAQWETAVQAGRDLGLRIAIFRTGFILAKSGGGLPAMAKPIAFFAGAPLGNGRQWVPWIHLEDMVKIYVFAVENPLSGIFNACAPFPVTNKTLTKAIARTLDRPVWPLSIPAKLIKLLLGEMSVVALMSTNTSAQKILNNGFNFRFTSISEALSNIYNP